MSTANNGLLDRLTDFARKTSRVIAWLLGALLLATIAVIAVEVVTRKLFGHSFRFVHEYAGYLLAIFSAWGLSHTLLERAHIRIDILYSKASLPLQKCLDLLSIVSMALIALLIAFYGYPLLERSIANGSLSNTTMSTPMWIPHLIWLAGYVWFSLVTMLLLTRGLRSFLPAYRGFADPLLSAEFNAEQH
jgi:TRAP-type C4-dicarboxylate transport system permease small subunit